MTEETKEESLKFFDGALTAYKDCAELVDRITNNLPAEIQFMRPSMLKIGEGIREKNKEFRVTYRRSS